MKRTREIEIEARYFSSWNSRLSSDSFHGGISSNGFCSGSTAWGYGMRHISSYSDSNSSGDNWSLEWNAIDDFHSSGRGIVNYFFVVFLYHFRYISMTEVVGRDKDSSNVAKDENVNDHSVKDSDSWSDCSSSNYFRYVNGSLNWDNYLASTYLVYYTNRNEITPFSYFMFSFFDMMSDL